MAAPANMSTGQWILPNGMVNKLIQRLKSTSAKINVSTNKGSNGKEVSTKTLKEKFRKEQLTTYTMQVIENIWIFDVTLVDLEATLNEYTDINQNHDELTEKILKKW